MLKHLFSYSSEGLVEGLVGRQRCGAGCWDFRTWKCALLFGLALCLGRWLRSLRAKVLVIMQQCKVQLKAW